MKRSRSAGRHALAEEPIKQRRRDPNEQKVVRLERQLKAAQNAHKKEMEKQRNMHAVQIAEIKVKLAESRKETKAVKSDLAEAHRAIKEAEARIRMTAGEREKAVERDERQLVRRKSDWESKLVKFRRLYTEYRSFFAPRRCQKVKRYSTKGRSARKK